MTKVMFQVGLLAFFISAIVFGTQDMPLMDMILRAFIVLIATILVQAVVFIMVASMKTKPKTGREKSIIESAPMAPPPEAEANAQQTTTPS
jgi:hypothetical protein